MMVLTNHGQDMLDENADILEARDRKEKTKLFKAIHQGDFDGVQPASRLLAPHP